MQPVTKARASVAFGAIVSDPFRCCLTHSFTFLPVYYPSDAKKAASFSVFGGSQSVAQVSLACPFTPRTPGLGHQGCTPPHFSWTLSVHQHRAEEAEGGVSARTLLVQRDRPSAKAGLWPAQLGKVGWSQH